MCGQALVLPSRCLMCPAADDDFVTNSTLWRHVKVARYFVCNLDKHSKIIEEVNKKLIELNIEIIMNYFKTEHFTRKGLHINKRGINVFAMNLIAGVPKS